jgi:hypothetical protein
MLLWGSGVSVFGRDTEVPERRKEKIKEIGVLRRRTVHLNLLVPFRSSIKILRREVSRRNDLRTH